MPKPKSSSNVLDFWFREILSEQWYKKDPAFDETIRDRFEPTVTAALASRLDSWANNADGGLALILLLELPLVIFLDHLIVLTFLLMKKLKLLFQK